MTQSPMKRASQPRRGYFGAYGGRFAPETLMAPLEELGAAFERCRRDRALPRRARRAAAQTTPAGPRRDRRRPPDRERRRRADRARSARIFSTPAPTSSTTRSARSCSRGAWARARVVAETGAGQHGVATAAAAAQARPAVPRLHGRRGHGAPGAERLAHAPARRGGRRRRLGLADPEGRDQRGHARLDGERRDDALRSRLGARPASLPHDRARVPVGDRPRGAARSSASSRAAIRSAAWPAWAEARTRSGSSRRTFHASAASSTASRRGAAGPARASTRRASRAARSASSTARRTMLLQDEAGQVLPTHSVSAGLDYPGRRARARAPARSRARRRTRRSPTTRRSTPSSCSLEPEGILPALESAHAVAFALRLARRCRSRRGSWSTSPGAATRTSTSTRGSRRAPASEPRSRRSLRAARDARTARPSSPT